MSGNREQHALLDALAEAWQEQRDVEVRYRAARERIGELLDTAQRTGLEAHRIAHVYLRAHARASSALALQRALAVIRKRRQRSRRRDGASRGIASVR